MNLLLHRALVATLALTWCSAQAISSEPSPNVKVVVQGGDPLQDYRESRKMLIGPGVNQPEHYQGYRGFVGWASPIVLHDGTMLVGFTSGYWHASPPTNFFKQHPDKLEEWGKLGMPTDVEAPRGGRAEIIRSTDGGRTWSKPTLLIDTPWDDRAPNFCQLKDGTILCSFFTLPGPDEDLSRDPNKTGLTGIIRSFDNARTWEQKPIRLPVPFLDDTTDGPIIELQDGSALICVYGRPAEGQNYSLAFCRSTDKGATWELLSVVSTDHDLTETSVVQLVDGRLVFMARREGDVAWSKDGGRTWSKPASTGIQMREPRLIPMRNGTLLCLHGSYRFKGFRAMFSRDGGMTWVSPNKYRGYPVDPSVYGYGSAVELADGTVWAVYIQSKGYSPEEARTEAIWSIRMRVRPTFDGIDLLPAPGLLP